VHNLREAGTLPDAEEYGHLRSEISAAGAALAGDLRRRLPSLQWRLALQALGRRHVEADVERVLGFGAALTRFAVAPACPEPGSVEVLVRAGAFMNMLAATFDEYIDRGVTPDRVMPKWLLLALLREHVGIARAAAWLPPAGRLLLARLLEEYVKAVQALQKPAPRPFLGSVLASTVEGMYDAEVLTVTSPATVTDQMLRTKNAGPFLAMGLPAWAPDQPSPWSYDTYVAWLSRIGNFFGAVDDAVDAKEDRHRGHPNLLLRQRLEASREGAEAALASAIAGEAGAIMADWRKAIGGRQIHPAVSGGFSACIASWLGGVT
jgi:hypothetical protein